MIKVSRGQIEAQIALAREKVALQQRFCHALKARGTEERAFIRALIVCLEPTASAGAEVALVQSGERFLEAHKAHYQAQTDAAEIALAEMKSQLAVAEAMLKEGENPSVILPSGIERAQ